MKANVSFFATILFIAFLCSLSRPEARAQSEVIYSLKELPTPSFNTASINTKGQVAGVAIVEDVPTLILWLPKADYGLEAGVHNYPIPAEVGGASFGIGTRLLDFADNGTALIRDQRSGPGGDNGSAYFFRGEFVALFGWSTGRPDLYAPANMSNSGVIYTWRGPYPNEAGLQLISILTEGPGVPSKEYVGDWLRKDIIPGVGTPRIEIMSLGFGNSNGKHPASNWIRDWVGPVFETFIPGIWNHGFEPLTPPVEGKFSGWGLNDKDQQVFLASALSDTIYYRLPIGDYSKEAGFHPLDISELGLSNDSFRSVSGNGEIYRQGFLTLFYSIPQDQFIDLATLFADNPNSVSRIHRINDNGKILVDGTDAEGTPKTFIVSPGISATVTVNARQVALDESFYFEVAIKNTSEEPFVVTGVYGESYRLIGSAIPGLQQLDNPPPSAIDPGETFKQRFPFKGSLPGKIKFAFKAAGFFADGTLNLTEELVTPEIQIGGDPVKIEFETLPLVPKNPPADLTEVSIVNMKVQEDPNNPGQFIVTDDIPNEDDIHDIINPKVKLKITNIWEQETPVTVTLQGLDTRKRDKTPLGARAKIVGTFPIDLGTLAHGESIEREFAIDIRDDGRFDFSALVTSSPEESTEQYNTQETGSPIAVGVPYPAKIEFKFDRFTSDIINNNGDGAFFLSPGGSLKVTASVENLTSNAKLNFFGIEAKKELNAFSSHLTSEEGNALDPPFVHDHEVDPNSAVVLSGFIKTDANGAAKGTVTWQMPEGAFLEDIESEEKTELTADDFLVETTVGGWLKDDLAVRVIQDPQSLPKTDLTDLEYAGLVAGAYTEATLIAMAKWMDDSIDTVGGIGRVAGTISADPSLLADKVGEGARAVWESAEFIHLGWTSMTQTEKDKFILDSADETWARAKLLVTAPFDKEKREAAIAYTNAAALSLMGGVTDAYASDDPARIAALYGTVTGNIAMEVLAAKVPAPDFTRFVKGGEVTKLAKAADNVRNPFNTQQTILRNVPSGPVTRQIAIDGWGIGGKFLDDVQEALGKLGMKGYARERAPRSLDLSEVLDEAVLKPAPVKAKGFSDLDRLMFGDNLPKIPGKNGDLLELDEMTAVVFPPSNTAIRNRLRASGQSDEVIEAVIARADFRRKEYVKRAPELDDLKRDGVEVDLNYKDNDAIGGPNQRPNVKRQFDFETIEIPGGGTIHVPKMTNKNGDFRFITGDVDWVHFSHLDGTSLLPSEAGRLYDYLAHCCGLKHGETVTWMNKGQSVFEGKANQIGEYLTGQKALLEVSGEGIRAARVRPNLTRFHPNQRSHLIFFDGGTKTLQKKLDDIILQENFAFLLSKLPPKKAIIPFLWADKAGNIGDDTTIDGQDWAYSADPDAVVAREVEENVYERFDGKNWVPWDPVANPNPNRPSVSTFSSNSIFQPQVGEKLSLAPTVVLRETAFAGDTVLAIADFATLWATELESHLDAWFTVGNTIVIAPGTPQQEVRKIVSFSPFEIDQAIRNDHIEDTVVSVVPESILANLDTIQEPRLLLDDPIVVEGVAAFEFEMPLGSQVVFETSDDLEFWIPIPREALVGGTILEETVQLDYPGEPIFIIMDSGGNKSFLRWKEASDTN